MKLNIEILRDKANSQFLPIILLHGFTGSSEDWFDISQGFNAAFPIYAIELPGHGKSESDDDISLYNAIALNESLKNAIDQLGLRKVIFAGYSMGGRAALNFTLSYPEIVHALILESTTPGIRNFEDRNDRIQNDERIASLISSSTIEKFIDYWMNIPLFESQKMLPKEKLDELKKSKLKNNKTGLANSLRGFGTGKMPVLWNDLKKITCQVLLITGEQDIKFTNINIEMTSMIKNVLHYIVPQCGHNVHLEKPEHFLNLTNNFLLKISKIKEE